MVESVLAFLFFFELLTISIKLSWLTQFVDQQRQQQQFPFTVLVVGLNRYIKKTLLMKHKWNKKLPHSKDYENGIFERGVYAYFLFFFFSEAHSFTWNVNKYWMKNIGIWKKKKRHRDRKFGWKSLILRLYNGGTMLTFYMLVWRAKKKENTVYSTVSDQYTIFSLFFRWLSGWMHWIRKSANAMHTRQI